ncbi:MAG: hypothetical protein EOM25_04405 [Deltaproteobacteria bacterium]|nr:hypothetical protein [Deltaproteobacteria bacterium]
MPVQPGNQFQGGGPKVVNPQVIYDQRAPQGFIGGLFSNLKSAVELAGGIKEMVTEDPTKEALAEQYRATADAQKATAEATRSRIPQTEREHWYKQANEARERVSKTSPGNRKQAMDLEKERLPQEFWGMLDASSMISETETASYLNAGMGDLLPGQSAASYPPTGPSQPPQETLPAASPPGSGAAPPPAPAEAPGGPPASAPPPQTPPFDPSMGPPPPAPEPFIRTPFGPVAAPQRPLASVEQINNHPQGAPPLQPDDVLPLSEAYSNPTLNAAVDSVYRSKEVLQRLSPARLAPIAAIFRAVQDGEAVPMDQIILAQMNDQDYSTHMQSQFEKLGVPLPGSGDLLAQARLAEFFQANGKPDWGPEVLGEFLHNYQTNPLLLRAHQPGAKVLMDMQIKGAELAAGMEKARLQYAGQVHTAEAGLQREQLRSATQLQTTGMTLGVKREEIGVARDRLGLDRSKMGQEASQKAFDRVAKTNDQINALLKQAGAPGVPAAVKQHLSLVSTYASQIRERERSISDFGKQIGEIDKKLQEYAHLPPTPPNPDPNKPPSGVGDSKWAMMMERDRLLQERKSASDWQAQAGDGLDDFVRPDGTKQPGLRTLYEQARTSLTEAARAADPTTQAGQTVLTINAQIDELIGNRTSHQRIADSLADPGKVMKALDDLAGKWDPRAAPPSFEQFMTTPLGGGGYGISAYIQDQTQVVEYWGYLRSRIEERSRDWKKKNRKAQPAGTGKKPTPKSP